MEVIKNAIELITAVITLISSIATLTIAVIDSRKIETAEEAVSFFQ